MSRVNQEDSHHLEIWFCLGMSELVKKIFKDARNVHNAGLWEKYEAYSGKVDRFAQLPPLGCKSENVWAFMGVLRVHVLPSHLEQTDQKSSLKI